MYGILGKRTCLGYPSNEKCNCKLVRPPQPRCKETACIDHDHNIYDRENIRNILCMSCNSKRQ